MVYTLARMLPAIRSLPLQGILLFGLLLSACTSPVVLPSDSPAPTGATASPTVPTAPLQPPTRTPTPRPTPTATRTPLPTLIPTPTTTSTPEPLACWQQGGRWEESSLPSDFVPLPLEYRVYLPPCYDQLPERRYPVLYLIHGQNFNDDQWLRLGVGETADRLVADGQLPPFLIVLPRDRKWAQPEEDGFGKALVEELIPWIDADYRTLPGRRYRALGGLSRGASWAVHLGLSRWDLFGVLGAHSLPVFWSDTRHVRDWLQAIPLDSLPRIFMDTGKKDYLIRSTLWFEGVLSQYGIPHEWYLYPGYHEEAYWSAHVEQYLQWYAQEWGDEDLQATPSAGD